MELVGSFGAALSCEAHVLPFFPCSGVSMQDASLAARGQSSRSRGRPKGGSKGGAGKGRSRKSIAGSAAAMAGAKAGAAAASAAAYAAYGYNVSKGTWGRAGTSPPRGGCLQPVKR